MRTFAKLWMMGYIGNKPKFSDKSHDLLASFQLAVHRKSKEDETQITDWYDILCVNQLADFTERVLQKGMLVYVEALPVFEDLVNVNVNGLKEKKLLWLELAELKYAVDETIQLRTLCSR